MDQQKVEMYLMSNQKMFPPEKIAFLKEKMLAAGPEKENLLLAIDLKSPTTMIVVSILLGGLGIDRFMLGDVGMGILKLLTGGVCGIMTIVDWCTIMKRTRELNFNNLMLNL